MPSSRVARLQSFLAELKRRRVFRVAAAYLVIAFALLQGADILAPALLLPSWTMTLLVLLAIGGLVVALVLAWVFDVMPGGIERTPDEHRVPRAAGARPMETDGGTSVAVLPFLNLSPEPEHDDFADGVTEDVIAHLSRIHSLRVISRGSVMQFRQRDRDLRAIAAALGVTSVLDGSVRHAGDRVRIAARLVDPFSGRHVWADTYDRRLTDIFAIQSDVAISIAAALRRELSLDERASIRRGQTRSVEAYQHYLRGRHLFVQFRREPLLRAIEYFRRAIVADPSYALAYASIAICYVQLAESGLIDADTARRETALAAAAALGIDPNLGEAHTAQAYMKFVLEFDYPAAEAEFRRAIELRPSDADAFDLYGRMCAALGRFDEALVLQRRSQELDPLNHRTDVATTLIRAGRYVEAEDDARRAVEFDPDNPRARATLGWAVFLQGRIDEGLAELEAAVKLDADTPQWLAQYGEALGLAGQRDAARDVLRRLEERARTSYVSPYHLAYVHTGLGEHERALDFLERAIAERTGAVHGLKGSFLFQALRDQPRFRALVDRMKLVDA